MTSQEETWLVCLFCSSVQSNKPALILRLLGCDRLSGAGEAEVNETCSVPLTSFQASRQFRSVFSEHFTALFKSLSLSLFLKIFLRDLHGGTVVKTLLPMEGAWVLSLVGELRSHSVAYTHTHTHTYIFIDISLYIYSVCVYTYTSFFEMEM